MLKMEVVFSQFQQCYAGPADFVIHCSVVFYGCLFSPDISCHLVSCSLVSVELIVAGGLLRHCHRPVTTRTHQAVPMYRLVSP